MPEERSLSVFPPQIKTEPPDPVLSRLAEDLVGSNVGQRINLDQLQTHPPEPVNSSEASEDVLHRVSIPDKTFIAQQISPISQSSGVEQVSNGQNLNSGKQPSDKNATTTNSAVDDGANKMDNTSAKGLFGWVTIDGINVPYLLRHEKKFLSVRMIEMKLLSRYPNCYPDELKDRPPVVSYFITAVEAKLLNEINIEHCAGEFGFTKFTTGDLIVSLLHFEDFYNIVKKVFPDTNAPNLPSSSTGDVPNSDVERDSGWLQINNTVVPYVIRNTTTLVPLSVLRFAAGLLRDVQVEKQLDPEEEECNLLNATCSAAEIDFRFAKATKLIPLELLYDYEKDISVKQLPKREPLNHAGYQANLAESREVKDAVNTSQPVVYPTGPQGPPYSPLPNVSLPVSVHAPPWLHPPMKMYASMEQNVPTIPYDLAYSKSPPPYPHSMFSAQQTNTDMPSSGFAQNSFLHTSALARYLAQRHVLPSNYMSDGMYGPYGQPGSSPVTMPDPSSHALKTLLMMSQSFKKHGADSYYTGDKFSRYSRPIPVQQNDAMSPLSPEFSSMSPYAMTGNHLAGTRTYIPDAGLHPMYKQSLNHPLSSLPNKTVPVIGGNLNYGQYNKTLSPGVQAVFMLQIPGQDRLEKTLNGRNSDWVYSNGGYTTKRPNSNSSGDSSDAKRSPFNSNVPTNAQLFTDANQNPVCHIKTTPYRNKSISCIVDVLGNKTALVEALGRVYFPDCPFEEFQKALNDILKIPTSMLTREQEQTFISHYGLRTKSLRCKQIIDIKCFDRFFPQLVYLCSKGTGKMVDGSDLNVNTQTPRGQKRPLADRNQPTAKHPVRRLEDAVNKLISGQHKQLTNQDNTLTKDAKTVPSRAASIDLPAESQNITSTDEKREASLSDSRNKEAALSDVSVTSAIPDCSTGSNISPPEAPEGFIANVEPVKQEAVSVW